MCSCETTEVMCSSLLCLILATALEKLGLPESAGEVGDGSQAVCCWKWAWARNLSSTSPFQSVNLYWFCGEGDDCLWPVLPAFECGLLDHEEGQLVLSLVARQATETDAGLIQTDIFCPGVFSEPPKSFRDVFGSCYSGFHPFVLPRLLQLAEAGSISK